MILDPRLIPWQDVAPGTGVAAILTALGAGLSSKRPLPGALLLLLAPVIGWTLIIYQVEGALPKIPPSDVALWSWYFALGGCLVAGARAALHTAPLAVQLVLTLLAAAAPAVAGWFALTAPFPPETLAALPAQFTAVLLLCAAIIFLALLPPPARYAPATHASIAEITSALTALGAFSAVLTLTGTAAVGLLALTLCLATLPAAAALLLLCARPTLPRPRPMAFWAPQVFALPVLAAAGPLYASTTWKDVLVILAGTAAAAAFVTGARYLLRSRSGFLFELILIAGALLLAAIPAAIVIAELLRQADESGAYY